jgi:hypothetical protein
MPIAGDGNAKLRWISGACVQIDAVRLPPHALVVINVLVLELVPGRWIG